MLPKVVRQWRDMSRQLQDCEGTENERTIAEFSRKHSGELAAWCEVEESRFLEAIEECEKSTPGDAALANAVLGTIAKVSSRKAPERFEGEIELATFQTTRDAWAVDLGELERALSGTSAKYVAFVGGDLDKNVAALERSTIRKAIGQIRKMPKASCWARVRKVPGGYRLELSWRDGRGGLRLWLAIRSRCTKTDFAIRLPIAVAEAKEFVAPQSQETCVVPDTVTAQEILAAQSQELERVEQPAKEPAIRAMRWVDERTDEMSKTNEAKANETIETIGQLSEACDKHGWNLSTFKGGTMVVIYSVKTKAKLAQVEADSFEKAVKKAVSIAIHA